MKTRVILNPHAGGAETLPGLRRRLRELAGAELCETDRPGHAEQLARRAAEDGFGLVVAAGGDGTLNEVLNGLAADFGRTRLGVLPLGTGNDFVRSIGVPEDVDGALAILRRGRCHRVDVARATIGRTRYFLNMSAGGFSDRVDENLDAETKRRWGSLSYLVSAATSLRGLVDHHAHLTIDGEQLEVDVYAMVVANARYVASGIPAAPTARLDDGYLDVHVFPEMSARELAFLVPLALLGRHEGSERVISRRAHRIEVDAQPPIAFNVDGEEMGCEPASFEVLPRALRVVVGELEQTSAEGDGG